MGIQQSVNPSFRLSFVSSTGPENLSTVSPRVSEALMTVAHSDALLTPENMMKLLYAMDSPDTTDEESKGLLTELFGKRAELVLNGELKFEETGKQIARKIGFRPGELGIVMNGRVSGRLCSAAADAYEMLCQIIGPLGSNAFTATDFLTLAAYELTKRVLPINMALADVLKIGDEESR